MRKIISRYEYRHAISLCFAVVIASCAGYLVEPQTAFWATLTALLVSQTTRGTPGRQSYHTLFLIMMVTIVAIWIGKYLPVQVHEVVIAALFFTVCGSVLMMSQPENIRESLQWLTPALIFLIAILWPLPFDGHLIDRLIQILVGGGIGMFFVNLVLPVIPYDEFSRGLVPVIDGLIDFSIELKASLIDKNDHSERLEARIEKIEWVMQSQQKRYPGWVFEEGFNPKLREGFRYVVLQLDYITDAFFTLDYLMRQPVDRSLLADVAEELASVVERNCELLNILRSFFDKGQIIHRSENYTRDISQARESVGSILPGNIDLLDMSLDYVNLSAIARNIIDIRELLLDLLASLPTEQVQVKQALGN